MGYTHEVWRNRYSERTDLATSLTHLTRATDESKIHEVLFKILSDGKILGSNTKEGFIVGKNKAVCFQDAPLHAICQNCWFEQKLRKGQSNAKVRYSPTGLLFKKTMIYTRGGRPVVYDSTEAAKSYLPESEWWRIVNFDISNEKKMVDWTHEREWRVKGDFDFEISDVVLLFTKPVTLKNFIALCDKEEKPYYKQVAGLVNLESILF